MKPVVNICLDNHPTRSVYLGSGQTKKDDVPRRVSVLVLTTELFDMKDWKYDSLMNTMPDEKVYTLSNYHH